MFALSAKDLTLGDVFQDVSLQVQAGEVVVLSGGDQELLQCLSGLRPPSSGEVSLRGSPGFFLPGWALLKSKTVGENLRLLSDFFGEQIFQVAGVAGLMDLLPSELTGPQSFAVTWARALTTRPAAIFAGDIFSGVDTAGLAELVRRCATDLGQAVVLATDDPNMLAIADRVLPAVSAARGRADSVPAEQALVEAAVVEPALTKPVLVETQTVEPELVGLAQLALDLEQPGLPPSLDELAPMRPLPPAQAEVVSRARRILERMPGPILDPNVDP